MSLRPVTVLSVFILVSLVSSGIYSGSYALELEEGASRNSTCNAIQLSGYSPEQSPVKAPFLYRMEKNDKSSLLLGTNHRFPMEYFSSSVREMIMAADFFMGECSLKKGSWITVKNIKFFNMLRCDDDTDIDLDWWPLLSLAEKDFLLQRVEPELKSYGIHDPIKQFKIIIVFFLVHSVISNTGFGAHLRRHVRALENKLASQRYFALDVGEKSDEIFRKILDQTSVGVEALKEIISNGQIDPLSLDWLSKRESRLLEGFTPVGGDAYELSQRNQNWIPLIESFTQMTEGKKSIMVGVAHLFGPKGLISLLENEGFSFTKYDPQSGIFRPMSFCPGVGVPDIGKPVKEW